MRTRDSFVVERWMRDRRERKSLCNKERSEEFKDGSGLRVGSARNAKAALEVSSTTVSAMRAIRVVVSNKYS